MTIPQDAVADPWQIVADLKRQLRESEERYALAMRAINEGFYEWDVATSEMHYSPRVCELVGLAPEELRTMADWTDLPTSRAKPIGSKPNIAIATLTAHGIGHGSMASGSGTKPAGCIELSARRATLPHKKRPRRRCARAWSSRPRPPRFYRSSTPRPVNSRRCSRPCSKRRRGFARRTADISCAISTETTPSLRDMVYSLNLQRFCRNSLNPALARLPRWSCKALPIFTSPI